MTVTLLNNRYQVLRVLGSGGFGETFLAEDTQMPSNRRCVIKQLKPIANNPQVYQLIQQRFQQEAAILEELGDRSNQIPKLYAYFIDNGQFYLVQEYIEGQTLTQKIQQQGVLSEIAVKGILIDILPILEFIHSKHIVHRDIKPDNIILRFADGKPVLIDFGAVKVSMGTIMTASGNSTPSIVIGTPGFMPMEQSVGRPVFSSDIYSLGLTAIYLLTGKIPSEFPTNPATGDILWRNFAFNISPDFAAVLDKAVQQSPRDRYLTARDMLIALQNPVAPTVPAIPTVPPANPTVIATPVNGGYVPTPTVQAPPPQYPPQTPSPIPPSPYPNTPAPNPGLGTWQQAVIVGGVIGTFIVGGLWVMGFNNPSTKSISSNSSPSPIAENTLTPTPTPTFTQTPTPTFTETPTPPIPTPTQRVIPSNSAYISQNEALQLINKWLAAKREIFAPPYNTDLGYQLLTGTVYTKFISKTSDPDACLENGGSEDDCLSSVDWLRRNRAYWVYGAQKVNSVRNFVASGNTATIEVSVTEKRTLYNSNGNIDQTQSGLFTSTTSYDLEYQNGQIKISNYK